jgi:hypothetical protein
MNKYTNTVTFWLKGRIVEKENTSFARLQQTEQPAAARQWLCKRISLETDMHTQQWKNYWKK